MWTRVKCKKSEVYKNSAASPSKTEPLALLSQLEEHGASCTAQLSSLAVFRCLSVFWFFVCFLIFILYWNRVDSQHCVSFRYTAK